MVTVVVFVFDLCILFWGYMGLFINFHLFILGNSSDFSMCILIGSIVWMALGVITLVSSYL